MKPNVHTIRKVASWILIIIALWLFSPPGLPPDDFINLIVGDALSRAFGFSLATGILLSYTVIPFAILYLGCVISPGETWSVLKGVVAKVKKVFLKVLSDPRLTIAALVMFVIMYFVYVHYIMDMLDLGTTTGVI